MKLRPRHTPEELARAWIANEQTTYDDITDSFLSYAIDAQHLAREVLRLREALEAWDKKICTASYWNRNAPDEESAPIYIDDEELHCRIREILEDRKTVQEPPDVFGDWPDIPGSKKAQS